MRRATLMFSEASKSIALRVAATLSGRGPLNRSQYLPHNSSSASKAKGCGKSSK